MAEQTMNNPLSGAEVVEAILDKLRTRLHSDCHLNPNSAYEWFTCKITIELDMHDTGVQIKVDQESSTMGGILDDTATLTGVRDEFYIEADAPNEVRIATGQPVPTLTKDEQGRQVEKGVRYPRKTVGKG